jgi:hypothetical protein
MHATAAWQLVSSSLSTITWIQERLVKLVNTTHGGKGQRFRSFYSVTSGIRCSTNDDETRILLHRINSMGQTWRICGENIMRSEHTDEEGLDNYYSEGRCISPSTTSTPLRKIENDACESYIERQAQSHSAVHMFSRLCRFTLMARLYGGSI